MAERIWIRQEGRLEGVQEETFRYEDDLQKLIAEHPELIDGEQVRPDDARRWILVAREKGIAETPDAGARWSLDHLIIDQDARLTLVEAKLRDNPEIHRKIVGQMLEYAAHAAETWTGSDLRRTFEESAASQGRNPDDLLAELLQDKEEQDPDAFWERVATNLAAKRLRLLFIADRIPDRLARVVEFLNGQMRDVEVLAVEIKRFHGDSGEIFVPRVIGRTAKTRSPAGPKLTRDSFLDALLSDEHREVANRLLVVAQRNGAILGWQKHSVTIGVVSTDQHLSPILRIRQGRGGRHDRLMDRAVGGGVASAPIYPTNSILRLRPSTFSAEEIGMGASTDQVQFISLDAVNQKPVGFDVRLPVPLPDAPKRMVAVARGQRFLLDQRLQQYPQLAQVLATCPGFPHVTLELCGTDGGQHVRCRGRGTAPRRLRTADPCRRPVPSSP